MGGGAHVPFFFGSLRGRVAVYAYACAPPFLFCSAVSVLFLLGCSSILLLFLLNRGRRFTGYIGSTL